VVQEQQQIVEPIRSFPTKGGLPAPVVQQEVQEVRSTVPAQVKGLPQLQEELPLSEPLPVEPIRTYPVKGQQQVQEVIPERVLPVKGSLPVVQEQAPILETIVRDEQVPFSTKGQSRLAFASESIATPMFAAPAMRSYGARALNLPAQADSVLATGISFTFSCENMPYGYYADVLNNCQVYHICKPLINNGLQSMQRFSFFCPAGTLFDQIKHVCMSANSADLTPCHLASNYFGHTVARFAAPMTYNTYTPMLPAASAMRSTFVSGKGATLPARKGLATPLENFRSSQTVVQQEVALPEQQELLPIREEPLPMVQQTQQFETINRA